MVNVILECNFEYANEAKGKKLKKIEKRLKFLQFFNNYHVNLIVKVSIHAKRLPLRVPIGIL
jgi:hypothetical protein